MKKPHPMGKETWMTAFKTLTLVCFALYLAIFASSAWAEPEKKTYKGGGYLLVTEKMTWSDARKHAESLGGHLATIGDREENKFVAGLAAEKDVLRIWIGLSDEASEGNFTWVTGEPLKYTNWARAEPNNFRGAEDYVSISWREGHPWNDGKGKDKNAFVVEFAPPKKEIVKTYVPKGFKIKSANVRFFESGAVMPEAKKRTYKSRFDKSKTRYIYVEFTIHFAYAAEKREDFRYKVYWFDADGKLYRKSSSGTHVLPGWKGWFHSIGLGFKDSGKWPAGKYKVDLFIREAKIASGEFEITGPKKPTQSTGTGLAGKWKFGRVNGPLMCEITLSKRPGKYGALIKSCNPNESYWELSGSELLFKNLNGLVTTRFRRISRTYWEGPYVPHLGRRDGIKHYLSKSIPKVKAGKKVETDKLVTKKVKYKAGSEYIGEFLNSERHGKGTMVYTNGQKYSGDWRKGKKHGKGVESWPSGNSYIGEYTNGRPSGGLFYWANGKVTWSYMNSKGKWVNKAAPKR